MQATETQDFSKAATLTFIKCGIPVLALTLLIGFVVLMPEQAAIFFSWIFSYFWPLALAGAQWLASALKFIGVAVFTLSLVVLMGFLWVSCTLNHLKKKGLTGSFYLRVTKVYRCLGTSGICLGLASLVCVICGATAGAVLDQGLLFAIFVLAFFVFCSVGIYTDDYNKSTWKEMEAKTVK
jgi:hypothetical protein